MGEGESRAGAKGARSARIAGIGRAKAGGAIVAKPRAVRIVGKWVHSESTDPSANVFRARAPGERIACLPRIAVKLRHDYTRLLME